MSRLIGMIVMQGGHARTGPPPDPNSRTSERKGGITLTKLENQPYPGQPPELEDYLPRPTDRHRAVWRRVWTYPQASMWAIREYMFDTVARYVVLSVDTEENDAPASKFTAIRQVSDDLGLTHAGMRQLGWQLVEPTDLMVDGDKEDRVSQQRERRMRESA